MRWTGHVAGIEEINIYKTQPGYLNGRQYLSKSENDIKLDIKEMGLEAVDLIQPTQERFNWCELVNMVTDLFNV